MRRHAALIPLSHHHHRALVAARHARAAAAAGADERLAAATAFLVFFDGHAVGHFREEEEQLFPLLMEDGAEAPAELVQALLQHARLRAQTHALRAELALGSVAVGSLTSLGELLDTHVRLEERELFPLIEQRAGLELDRLLEPVATDAQPALGPDDRVVDLARPQHGRGPQWGMASPELNATLLAWSAGEGFAEHRNDERDVLVVVLAGSATVELDGVLLELSDHQLLLLPRGSVRSLVAGPVGVRYLSVHRRRDPLVPRSRDA